MLSDVATRRGDGHAALDKMMETLPQSMTVGWAIVLEDNNGVRRVTASTAAPEDNGETLDVTPVTEARVLNPEREGWIPDSWSVLETALAATPIQGTDLLLVIGRPGGPDFLLGEVEHLRQLGTIVGAFFS